MNKFILTSLLLILFLGIVTSSDLEVVKGREDFTTSEELRGTYRQQMKDSDDGYHKADIYFKANISSFNPDKSGVDDVDCKRVKNDKKISFSLKDRKAINTVKRWPNKVMLLVSHKWKCFGKKETQFFMVTDRVIDESKKLVTFAAEDCEASDWLKEYDINVDWVEQNNNTRRSLDKRLFGINFGNFGIPFPTINPSTKISLNALFDGKTGRSSRRNLQLINQSGIKLLCTDCFTAGEATISLRIAGNVVPPKLKDASITLNGSFKLNIDLALEAAAAKNIAKGRKGRKGRNDVGKAVAVNDFKLISIPLGPINIPGIFNAGPSFDLVATAELGAAVTGTLEFGGDINFPNFRARASFNSLPPTFEQSGFSPNVNPHKPNIDVEASVNIAGSLKPQLGFGVTILGGRLLDQRVGFQIVATLDNSLSFGSNNKCRRRTQPRLESTLGGNIGFFANQDDFPILEFPELTLINKCIL